MKAVNVMNVVLLRIYGLVLFADLLVVSMFKHSETVHNNRYKMEMMDRDQRLYFKDKVTV
jgi:hypothetical protein